MMANSDASSYIWRDMLGMSKDKALNFCSILLAKSTEVGSGLTYQCEEMKRFAKTRSLHLVWMSDQFRKNMSSDELDSNTYRLLSEEYDDLFDQLAGNADPRDLLDGLVDPIDAELLSSRDSDVQNDRNTQQQQRKHLFAFFILFDAATKKVQLSDTKKVQLSEDLIKHAHRLLIKGLKRSDGSGAVMAGEYRDHMVHIGNHTFLPHEEVPKAMELFVKKFAAPTPADHDKYWRAARMLFEFLAIHPFEDGNGRIARLLWCFSLLRDGIPFPLTPFPGRHSAYKIYKSSILKDQNALMGDCRHLTTLTLASVTETWINFITTDLKHVSPDKHARIMESMTPLTVTELRENLGSPLPE